MGKTKQQMGPVSRLLVRWFVPRGRAEASPERERAAYGLLEGYVALVVNTALFAVKLVLGLLTSSIALIADAVHSLSDSLTSGVVIAGSYVARRPPDEKHPFGHGRSEAVAAVIIAVLLGVAAVEFGRESVLRILQPASVDAPWSFIAVVAATALVKEWLSRFALALARATDNTAIEADAWHHRSDVFSTILVVAGLVGCRYGIWSLDGWMGVGVSLIILKVGIDVARRAIDPLLGRAPGAEQVREIRDRALSVDGVQGVHDIVVHDYGHVRLVSLHIETTSKTSPAKLHTVAELVEHRVARGRHGSVCVHVDPIDRSHPEYAAIRSIVENTVADHPTMESFHDLRIVGGADDYAVVLDLNLAPNCDEQQRDEAKRQLEEAILRGSKATAVLIEVEPNYSYQV